MNKTAVVAIFVVLVACAVAAGILAWVSRVSLPVLAEVSDFSLIDQDGQPLRRTDLRGRIWIANFIFTRCAGPCPLMTSTLRAMQEDLPPGIRFVSFSVDPEHDTPERLRGYAELHTADLGRWSFLTGDRKPIYDLADRLHLTAKDQGEGQIFHSSRFLLIDGGGRVRAWPAVIGADLKIDEEALEHLKREAAVLDRVRKLPPVNAGLNGLSGLFLIVGFFFIRARQVRAHKMCMISALASSTLFLVSYLTYHAYAGSTPFAGTGWTRPFYFTVLISHTILAAFIVPLALITFFRAWKEDFPRHRKIARWTLPIWLYVSVTGVLVYFMLYHWFPGG